MALTKFGFIVTGAKLDPRQNRVVMESPAFTMIAVGVERAEEGVEVAKGLVAEGVQLIELCGGFGPVWTAKVIEAVGGKVPVGSVGYGPESITRCTRSSNEPSACHRVAVLTGEGAS